MDLSITTTRDARALQLRNWAAAILAENPGLSADPADGWRFAKLADVRAAVRAKGLSNLCAPRELRFVQSIPKLGSGKTDHRELARMLREGETTAEAAPAAVA